MRQSEHDVAGRRKRVQQSGRIGLDGEPRSRRRGNQRDRERRRSVDAIGEEVFLGSSCQGRTCRQHQFAPTGAALDGKLKATSIAFHCGRPGDCNRRVVERRSRFADGPFVQRWRCHGRLRHDSRRGANVAGQSVQALRAFAHVQRRAGAQLVQGIDGCLRMGCSGTQHAAEDGCNSHCRLADLRSWRSSHS